MPKVHSDVQLLQQINAFVQECGGCCSSAAKQLGVDKTTLWRFQKKGCAIERTRNKLREAIKQRESATTPLKSNKNEAYHEVGGPSLAKDELKRLKTMFQTMITVIDLYEALIRNSNMGAKASGKRSGAVSSHDIVSR